MGKAWKSPKAEFIAKVTAEHLEKLCRAADPSRNKSGYRGISFDNSRRKWLAQYVEHGVMTKFGYYDDALEAAKARVDYEFELHGKVAKRQISKKKAINTSLTSSKRN